MGRVQPQYAEQWPVITSRKDPMPGYEEMDGKPGKMALFSETAGPGD